MNRIYIVDIDICDLSIHELSLVRNKSWLIWRSTLTKNKKKMRQKQILEVNLGFNNDPDVVSTVMHHVSDRVVLRFCVDRCRYKNKSMYITTYDIKQAIDSLWIQDCIMALKRLGVEDYLLQLVYKLLTSLFR